MNKEEFIVAIELLIPQPSEQHTAWWVNYADSIVQAIIKGGRYTVDAEDYDRCYQHIYDALSEISQGNHPEQLQNTYENYRNTSSYLLRDKAVFEVMECGGSFLKAKKLLQKFIEQRSVS